MSSESLGRDSHSDLENSDQLFCLLILQFAAKVETDSRLEHAAAGAIVDAFAVELVA